MPCLADSNGDGVYLNRRCRGWQRIPNLIMRRVLKIVVVVVLVGLVLMSALSFLAAVATFFNAPKTAAKNAVIKAALERRAAFMDEFVRTRGTFPSPDAFEQYSKTIDDTGYPYFMDFDGSGVWSSDGSLKLVPSGQAYKIKMWRGEWYEEYDSAKRKTSVDDWVTAGVWRRDAIWPLGFCILFGALPAWVLWWKGNRSRLRS